MKRRLFTVGALASVALAGCAGRNGLPRYTGPEVTSVVVNKSARKLYLLHGDDVLRDYNVGLGFTPLGHKMFEGDGRTPEGSYLINRRNPRSEFYLSLGISYPNTTDRARAQAMGKSPGGDIFIHGQPLTYKPKKTDWTAGCIAVQNEEIAEIYTMVRDGTLITLRA
jgi:murein L,D-transpeptidase YafK